jgi:hypothetical protein
VKIKYIFTDFVRWIGKLVCKIKGHNYFHPGGLHATWCAYICIRCGETDKPIESLPRPPEDEFFTDLYESMPEEYVNEQYERERRWISWAPYPHWI